MQETKGEATVSSRGGHWFGVAGHGSRSEEALFKGHLFDETFKSTANIALMSVANPVHVASNVSLWVSIGCF